MTDRYFFYIVKDEYLSGDHMKKHRNHPITTNNPYGAGRPKVRYKTKRVTIPADIWEEVQQLIEDYKRDISDEG